jgi:type IX secretion system PorP/SprF family membrane protein
MYWAVPTAYNPATCGLDSSLHVSAFVRSQWVGVENAPSTYFFGADLPFKFLRREHAAGLMLMNDEAGLFTTTSFALQYAFKMPLWGGQLSVGFQGGAVNQAFAGGEIFIPDGDAWNPSDDALPTGNVSAMAFDCAAGVYYTRGMFYGGIAAQHLPAASLELDEYAYSELSRIYYFHLGGNIPIKRTLFLMQPSVLVRSTLLGRRHLSTRRCGRSASRRRREEFPFRLFLRRGYLGVGASLRRQPRTDGFLYCQARYG